MDLSIVIKQYLKNGWSKIMQVVFKKTILDKLDETIEAIKNQAKVDYLLLEVYEAIELYSKHQDSPYINLNNATSHQFYHGQVPVYYKGYRLVVSDQTSPSFIYRETMTEKPKSLQTSLLPSNLNTGYVLTGDDKVSVAPSLFFKHNGKTGTIINGASCNLEVTNVILKPGQSLEIK